MRSFDPVPEAQSEPPLKRTRSISSWQSVSYQKYRAVAGGTEGGGHDCGEENSRKPAVLERTNPLFA